MKKAIIGIVCAVITVFAAYCIHNNTSVFTGSRVKNPDCYTLSFSAMNQQDSHTMALNRGDTLAVDYDIHKGHADLIVSLDGESRIYTGRDIRSGIFELPITQDGTYLIEIKAKHAAGYLTIRRVEAADGEKR